MLDGDEWVINGTKQFITNSGTPITSVVVITAVTGEKKGKDGNLKKELDRFLVPTDTPGFTAEGATTRSAGTPPTRTRSRSRTCACPAANLLGERGRGYANFLQVLDEGRIAFAALCAGAAQGCLEEALRYAKERVVFGKPIGENQYVAFMIAQMQARVHTAHLCSWMRRARWSPASLSRPRQRSPRWSRAKPPWTTPATRRRSGAATGS